MSGLALGMHLGAVVHGVWRVCRRLLAWTTINFCFLCAPLGEYLWAAASFLVRALLLKMASAFKPNYVASLGAKKNRATPKNPNLLFQVVDHIHLLKRPALQTCLGCGE